MKAEGWFCWVCLLSGVWKLILKNRVRSKDSSKSALSKLELHPVWDRHHVLYPHPGKSAQVRQPSFLHIGKNKIKHQNGKRRKKNKCQEKSKLLRGFFPDLLRLFRKSLFPSSLLSYESLAGTKNRFIAFTIVKGDILNANDDAILSAIKDGLYSGL